MKCQGQQQLIIRNYEEIYFLLQYIFFFCPVVLETAQPFNVEVLRQNFIVQELSYLIRTVLPHEIRNVKSSDLFKKKTREWTPAPNSYECYH